LDSRRGMCPVIPSRTRLLILGAAVAIGLLLSPRGCDAYEIKPVVYQRLVKKTEALVSRWLVRLEPEVKLQAGLEPPAGIEPATC
jgi:hypothetical protein